MDQFIRTSANLCLILREFTIQFAFLKGFYLGTAFALASVYAEPKPRSDDEASDNSADII